MLETWKFLRTLLDGLDGEEEREEGRSQEGRRHEGRSQERRRDDGRRYETAADDDLDDIPAEETMLLLLRRLSMSGLEPFRPDAPTKPEVDTPAAKPEARTPSLPDCIPACVNQISTSPDVVQRRRSVFRVDSQWLQGTDRTRDGSRDEERGTMISPTGRRWSYSGSDDVDGGGRMYHELGQSLSGQRGDEGRWEGGQGEVVPPFSRGDKKWQRRSTGDRNRRSNWSRAGDELARLSLRRKMETSPLELARCGNPAPGMYGNPAPEIYGNHAPEPRVGRRNLRERRHSIATSVYRVSQRSSLLADMFVLATLAGAYYCVNKLKAALV